MNNTRIVKPIERGMSSIELAYQLRLINIDEYRRIYFHKKSGNYYCVIEFSVLNQDGGAEFAVNYSPCSSFGGDSWDVNTDILFTRPAREFYDGRFSLVTN
jgi:hypothetical protein